MNPQDETVRTLANAIQVVFHVVTESAGNAFEIPESRRGNNTLIQQDIGRAIVAKIKEKRGAL